jgi:hypothetical protein
MEAEETVNMLRAGKEIVFSTNNASVGAIFTELLGVGLSSIGLAAMFANIIVGLVFLAIGLFLLWSSYSQASGKIIGKKVILKRYLNNIRYQITLDDIESVDIVRKQAKAFSPHYNHTKIRFAIAGKSRTLEIVTPDGWIVSREDSAQKVLHMAMELNKEGLL